MLVNKIDVITDKEYKTEIKQYAKENDMMFYKCCASDPTTLNEAFKYIVDKLYPNTAKEKMNKQTKFSKYRSQVKTFSCCRIF